MTTITREKIAELREWCDALDVTERPGPGEFDATRAIREALDLAESALCRPIEEAPKDGTIIDVWHESGFRIPDVWWDEAEGIWACAFQRGEGLTHFRAVPAVDGRPITPPEAAE